ncbi:MAG: HD domain-containing protein [Candidatus Paceibacterota bacterium]|jgi:putative hydrolase of HD superfamily
MSTLKYAKIAPDIWKALDAIPRTGWVKRGVSNPESVQKHIILCRELVTKLVIDLPEFSVAEISEIQDILEVHDYPEYINGDQVIVTEDQEEKKKLKLEKFQREYDAMIEITKDLGDIGAEMFNLWLRFEKENDRISIFAKQIDKFQSIEKAFEYEKRGENVFVQDFIDGYRDEIIHPVLVKRMLRIEQLCKKRS